MGQKNNPWEHRFTASSPYRTADGKHNLFYLVRPDGNNLVCVVENEIDGYRIRYSDFLCGHCILGLQFLSQFDRAYGKPKRADKQITVRIQDVSTYIEAWEPASRLWGVPALYYETASTYIRQPFRFSVCGNLDSIVITAPSGEKEVLKTAVFASA